MKELLSYQEYYDILKNNIFGIININKSFIRSEYEKIIESLDIANKEAIEYVNQWSSLPVDEVKDYVNNTFLESKNELFEDIINHIHKIFINKTIAKDGYCLKSKLLNHAVQMKTNENMLGFICKLDEKSSRFVMVDFGDKEGPVKIDIEELIIG